MLSIFHRFVRPMMVTLLLALALPLAQAQEDFVRVQPPQPTENPAKIEVLEFFSYGCPHCAQFHGPLGAWAAKLPADVVVRRVPISFGRAAWANLQRLFYALEATGDLAKLDGEVFKAIHDQRINLFEEKSIIEWLAQKGANTKAFSDAFNSFGVQSKAKRADQTMSNYSNALPRPVAERFGVPALFIDGKYLLEARDSREMLVAADKLIARARAERAKK